MTTFIELCAGSAALSCVLTGGPNAKPPTSYQGSKRGYWRPILGCFGLRAGSRPRIILAEPGPYGACWRFLSQPGGAEQVAAIIRGWEGEEPRVLWTRLRDEWRKDPELRGVREVASSVVLLRWSIKQNPRDGYYGPGFNSGMMSQEARDDALSLDRMANALDSVARWLLLASWSYRQGDVGSGLVMGSAEKMEEWVTEGRGATATATATATAGQQATGWTIYDRAQDVPIPLGASDHFVYIDPPYAKTTGYANDLPRDEVVRIASQWADAGAFVGVSEQEPIPALMDAGWCAVRIDQDRTGQKRTFSRQQGEWLTLSRPPVVRPGIQEGLW